MIGNRTLWVLAAALTLVAAGAALYKIRPLLNPEVVGVAPLNPDCDLRGGACTVGLPDGGQLRFLIEPRDIPVVRPLRLQVWIDGLDARGVEVDFSGVDMNMGFNRPRLEAAGPGHFEGAAMLPVCVRAHMTWEARVLVRTGAGLLAAPFRFDTFRPGPAPGR